MLAAPPLLVPRTNPKAEEYQRSPREKAACKRFVKNQPGKEYGGQRIDVNPICASDGAQPCHTFVPRQVAQHRGDTAQKKQIAQNGRAKQNIMRGKRF